MPIPKIEYVADHRCPISGNLHKIAVCFHGLEDMPKIGDMVEYDCPVCMEKHQFKPKSWGGPGTPFPAKHYRSGRIIKPV